MRIARLFIAIALVGLLAAACGGDDDADPDAAATARSTATITSVTETTDDESETEEASATATTEDDEQESNASDDAGSGSSIELVGAVNATIDEPASCGKGVMGYDYQAVGSATDADDELWLFQIYISNFEDTPGEFEVSSDSTYKKASVTVSDGMGTSWETTGDSPGSVVVSEDMQSGTIDTTLTSSDGTAEEITVSGSWVCDAE